MAKTQQKQRKVTKKRKIKREESFRHPSEHAPAPKMLTRINLQDGNEFLHSVVENDRKVEEMIRNQNIPNRSILEVAVRENGYSLSIQRALTEMSKVLLGKISEAVDVWCGYKPKNPLTPVFVVTLKNQKCILDKRKIPEPFTDYKIVTRYKYVPNNEERCIVELCGSTSVRSEDVARVNNCIAKHTESLMREHSNLSIIRACSVKARGYTKKKLEVENDTCIVFYVPVKGIIPVGENEFPKIIDRLVTDVREGEFVLFGDHKSFEYHPQLRMGCCIHRCICRTDECNDGNGCKIGTLGGFIDLPDESVGCLTAAHAVLPDCGIKTYVEKSDEEKRGINCSLAQGQLIIEMHQPMLSPGHKPFGKVLTIALEEGNTDAPSVDAAIIQITDENRIPETGSFPDGDFGDMFGGLTKEYPLLFTSGKILDEADVNQEDSLVIKFGCVTGLTSGYLNNSESCVRPVKMDSNYCFPVMFRQLEVRNNKHHIFATEGDSGALVFLCVGGNIRNLCVIGMVIGGNTAGGTCVVTPIKAIFYKLGLINNRFKVFRPSQPTQFTERTSTQSQPHSNLNEALKPLSEKISSLEQNLSNRMGILEKDINAIKESLNSTGHPK